MTRSVLRKLGVNAALQDRRSAMGTIATLFLPLAFLTAFFSHFFVGSLSETVLGLVVGGLPILALTVGFIFLVTEAAFSVSTERREHRYRLLQTMGAEPSHVRRVLLAETGIPAITGALTGLFVGWLFAPPLWGLLADRQLLSDIDIASRSWAQLLSLSIVFAPPTVAGILLGAVRPATNALQPKPTTGPTPLTPVRIPALGGLASLALLILSVLAFSFAWRHPWLQWLQPFEEAAWLGMAVGVLGLLAAAATLLPHVFAHLRRLGSKGPTFWRLTIRFLSARPKRAARLAGAMVALSALVVMATAGLESDREEFESVSEGHRVTLQTGRERVIDGILERLVSDGNTITATVEHRPVSLPITAVDQNGRGITGEVMVVTDEVASALQLNAVERRALANGELLVDSQLVDHVHSNGSDELDFLRVTRGGGVGQPGPLLYVAETHPLLEPTFGRLVPYGPLATVVWLESPPSARVRNDINNFTSQEQVWVEFSRNEETSALIALLTGFGASLIAALGLAGSVMNASESRHDLAAISALGTAPFVQRSVLATQTLLQLFVGTAVGSSVGVGLFWLVTRGDSSVPTAIFPWLTIGALTAIAPMLATAMAWFLAGPTAPAISRRRQVA